MSIEEIRTIAKSCNAEIEKKIYFAWEDDECTQCYKQGVEDALEQINHLLDTIETAYQKHKQEEIFKSEVIPQEGQLKLPLEVE